MVVDVGVGAGLHSRRVLIVVTNVMIAVAVPSPQSPCVPSRHEDHELQLPCQCDMPSG